MQFITAQTGYRYSYQLHNMNGIIDRRIYRGWKIEPYAVPHYAVFSVYAFMSNLVVTLNYSEN